MNLRFLSWAKSAFGFGHIYVCSSMLLSSGVNGVFPLKLSDVLCRPFQGLAVLKA